MVNCVCHTAKRGKQIHHKANLMKSQTATEYLWL